MKPCRSVAATRGEGGSHVSVMLEVAGLSLSGEVGLIDGCQSFPYSLLNLGAMISKRDVTSTAETLNKLVLHSWNLVSTNGQVHFLN